MLTDLHPSIAVAIDAAEITHYQRGAICETAKQLQSLLSDVPFFGSLQVALVSSETPVDRLSTTDG